jgi:hypothetical protein
MSFPNGLSWMNIICHRWIWSATEISIHMLQTNSKMICLGCSKLDLSEWFQSFILQDNINNTWKGSNTLSLNSGLWKFISITSMELDLWVRKTVVLRIRLLQKWNAQTFLRKAKFYTEKETKWTSKPQKIQNFPASIPHFPAKTTFWSKFFHNTDVVRGFSEQIFP